MNDKQEKAYQNLWAVATAVPGGDFGFTCIYMECRKAKKPGILSAIKRAIKRRWSQDSRLGGHGVRISSQLGHIPGTSGGPWTLKCMGGTPE